MKKRIVVLLFALTALCLNIAAQDGLVTDFTTGEEPQLVTVGDYVLRGTTLVQYRGNAEDVIIPANLGITEIGEGVFGRDGIRTVLFPEGVTKLGSRVFYECYNLESITLPRSLVEIGEYLVWGYSSLESISLPAALAIIADRAFAGCARLTTIQVDGANPYYAARDGVLFNKSFTELVAYPRGKPGSSYAIPAGVRTIRGNAFSNSKLASVDLPAGLTSIGEWAFSGCSSLTTISLPAALAIIADRAFAGCAELTTIQVDGANPYYAARDGVLFNKNFTELVAYPRGKPGSSYAIPAGVRTIRGNAFSNSKLASVDLPASFTSIGQRAFEGCSDLTAISLPAGLTSIGEWAFSGCSSLTTVNLPEGLTSIGEWAFSGCSSLTTISLPAGLTSIGEWAFSGCSSLTTIQVDQANQHYAEREGVLFNKDFTELIGYPAGKAGTSYTVPAGVTSIGTNAFEGCSSLTTISLPAGLTSIGEWAFDGCSSLTTINLPASLTSIGERAFSGCSNLTTINLPEGLTSIGYRAFDGCSSLTSMSLPASLTSIGQDAFSGCSKLSSITVASLEPPRLNGSLWSSASQVPALIYVPAAALNTYKNAAGWKNHADKIRAAGE